MTIIGFEFETGYIFNFFHEKYNYARNFHVRNENKYIMGQKSLDMSELSDSNINRTF